MTEPTDVLVRFALDAVALGVLVYGLYLPRHRRMDLAVLFVMFNAGVFLAVVVVTGARVSLGVGLGLFAVLSMIRLRSETFSNSELAYFFVALVLALICAIDVGGLEHAAILSAVALLVAWAVDHPRLSRRTRRLEVTLELVFADQDALRRHLCERLNAEVTDVWVLEIDYVRETTRAAVRYVAGPRTVSHPEEVVDAGVPVSGR